MLNRALFFLVKEPCASACNHGRSKRPHWLSFSSLPTLSVLASPCRMTANIPKLFLCVCVFSTPFVLPPFELTSLHFLSSFHFTFSSENGVSVHTCGRKTCDRRIRVGMNPLPFARRKQNHMLLLFRQYC